MIASTNMVAAQWDQLIHSYLHIPSDIWTYLDLSGLDQSGLDWTGVCEKDYLQEISSDKSDKKPNINQTYQRNQ